MKTVLYERRGAKIFIPKPENLKDVWLLIKSDAVRYGVKSKRGIFFLIIRNQGFGYTFYFRLSSIRSIFYPFSRIMKYRIGKKYGLQMSQKVSLGYGFFLLHPFGLIVHDSAIIGNNCTISQYVTIGAMTNRAAFICDEVYIGASACIVEDCVVGGNAVIGAGAVVVNDVLPKSTVGGVPAKLISNNDSKKFIWNKFLIQ